MIDLLLDGVLIGVVATVCMDIWSVVAKHALRLPTAHWDLVGRWLGHMPRGVFVHRQIGDAEPVPNELAIGWIAHYTTGIVYGIAYLLIVQLVLSREPSLVSALAFGLVTLAAPWLVMQPAMGAGAFASKIPRPGIVRFVNLTMHTVFGVSLYLGWRLIQ